MDKVQKEHTLADVSFCYAYNESEVSFNELVLCDLVALRHLYRKLLLGFGVKKRDLTDLLEVHSYRVVY